MEGTDASQGAKTLATRVRAIATPAETTGLGRLQLEGNNEVHPARPIESRGDERASQSPVGSSSSSEIYVAIEDSNEKDKGTGSATNEALATMEDGSDIDLIDASD